jgi:type IV pilus assembly protein PilY1
MNALRLAVLLVASVAAAQGNNLCTNALPSDNQPPFDVTNVPDRTAVTITPSKQLKLETALVPFNPEKIILPVDQRLTISYVYESAGATHTIGYLYYDDLIAAGYINTNSTANSDDDTLVDSNGNGIVDFHEDLYNLSPNNSADARYRPYVGRLSDRRCTSTFTSGGFTFTSPELATNGCTSNYLANQSLRDASRPSVWGSGPNITADVVGSTGTFSNTAFNDKGLFGSVPNLLEPTAPENGNRGLGRLVFLLNDDDSDTSVWSGFPPIADATALVDGIPDYDVTSYDSTGRLMASNPNPGITSSDRTVDLGVVPGGKELVFFMISYYSPGHGSDRVYPCLRFTAGGQCALHLVSPVSVFFSKARFNLDQNPSASDPAAVRNIGCGYPGSSLATGPSTSPYKNTVQGCWLDATTVARLNTASYNNLSMPQEATVVPRPTNGRMPHVIVGAPSSDPYRWIFGFEDLTGGGDRDFNDVVVLINKINGGTARAATVSGVIPVADANSMTITKVRFRRQDDISRGAWTEAVPGACNGPPSPSIRYSIALDCRDCSSGTCVNNPAPTWSEVVFPPGVNELTIDTLDLGLIGSQLCWRVDMTSPRDTCTPVVDEVDVGYQAIRTGDYSRSAVIPIANTSLFGVYETPGTPWNGSTTAKPTPSWRTFDGKKDYQLRGHLYDQRLYDPDSSTPTVTAPALLWDAAERLATSMSSRVSDPFGRKIYTLSASNTRIELKDELLLATTPALPSTAYNTQSLGKYPYDLNRSSAGNAPADDADRLFLSEWLYGWEDRQGVASTLCTADGSCRRQGSNGSPVARAWPMGGVQLSAPAVVTAPATASWFNFASSNERAAFMSNFQEPLKARPTVAFVGTLTGFLHAFDAGAYRRGDDPCTGPSARGYFLKSPCTSARNYGTASELFAYAPRALLSKYVRNYIGDLSGQSTAPAQINAPPSFADIDLGGLTGSPDWTIDTQGRADKGAKTVLISASGPRSDVVFALDVTDPSKASVTDVTKLRYPLPMWEWRMGSVLPLTGASKQPDTRGSRHSPPIVRADFGPVWGKRWIAAVATDFVPNSGTAGTVYLIDLATGAPVKFGTLTVGIITLELNEGVGGEPSAADIDADGSYDVLYVPSTSGKVFRISFGQFNALSAVNQRLTACVVADTAPTLLAQGVGPTDAARQGIYSPLALKVQRQSSPTVQLFYGTADDPDDPNDAQASRYYVMAFEDESPLGACGARPMWQQELNQGQEVWGGVSLGKESVFAVTAVGTAADACNLSPSEPGRLYSIPQAQLTRNSPYSAPSAPQVPPSVSGGMVYDEQFLFTTADGRLKAAGSGTWNNAPAASTTARRRVLMWEALPPGRLP